MSAQVPNIGGDAPRPPRGRREPELGGQHELSQILIRQSGLTQHDIDRIGSVQEQLGLGFIEAAMRLGLVTQADLDAALGGDVGGVPSRHVHARASSELVSAHDPFDPFSESIRALRTELLLRAQGEDSNVIAICSPASGEGRSRLAAELAVAFAQLGQPTLLVDSDLRESRQHELFGAANELGLAQALMEGKAPALKTVSGLPMRSLLTAGPRPPNPLELLSDPVFGDLLSGWRRRHKHVLIDTPPVSEYADALAVATHARRVLIVARANRTRLKQSRAMLQRLEATRARIVGSVLSTF